MAKIISVTLNVGLTGLVHLLCCWLPLLVVFFNGASVAWLAEYRTPLIMLQLGVLAWSFYDLYLRPAHRATAFEKRILWVAVGLTVVLNLIPHRYFQAEDSQLAQAQFERIRNTRVAQFELQRPVKSVEKLNSALLAVEGIVPSQIKMDNEVVSVRYYLGKTSEKTILATLRKQGYEVSMVD
ncbi:MAG: hypothetical protein U0X91_23785 [Spirosomataceae bacterium]